MARAIVNEPRVLLLDEPLGALDLKLRQEMEYELVRLKKELGITFIYITHDQEEALTMSDKVVVMNEGYIQQEGTPQQIYDEPVNAFVADFIGDSNILSGQMVDEKVVRIDGIDYPCIDGRDEGLFMVDCFSLAKRRKQVLLCLTFSKKNKKRAFFLQETTSPAAAEEDISSSFTN